MNKVFLTGNLTRDPETKTTKDGTGLCTFTIAVNNGKDTDFFRVTAWRKLADICRQYLSKGRKVAVSGSVSASAYTDRNGDIRASLEVQADNVEFLSSPKDAEETYVQQEREAIQQERSFVTVDEPLPF